MKVHAAPSSRHVAVKVGHGLLACTCLLWLGTGLQAQTDAPQADSLEQELEATFNELETAFNKHDAQAIAKLWQKEAVHRQSAFAGSLKGRPAILAAYKALFNSDPEARLVITLNSYREVSPNVVSAKCSTQLVHTDHAVSFSRLSVLLAKEGGQWLISEVDETDIPASSAASTKALHRLGWLVGNWIDTSEKSVVSNHVQWISGGNFLARQYQINTPGGMSQSGMQIIGWDSEHNVLRCWQFDGDGSFGEGTFEQTSANKWRCPMVVKLPDGRRASYSQVIERVSDDQLKLSLVNMEVDGQVLPGTGPDKLTRHGN